MTNKPIIFPIIIIIILSLAVTILYRLYIAKQNSIERAHLDYLNYQRSQEQAPWGGPWSE